MSFNFMAVVTMLNLHFSFILHNSGPQKALAHLTEEDADAHRASVTSTFCFSTPHTKCVAKADGKLP